MSWKNHLLAYMKRGYEVVAVGSHVSLIKPRKGAKANKGGVMPNDGAKGLISLAVFAGAIDNARERRQLARELADWLNKELKDAN